MSLQTTLVGAGHYGRNLVGPKYAQNRWTTAPISAVVDPHVPTDVYEQSVLKAIPLHRSFANWLQQVAKQNGSVANQILDLALKPEIIPSAFREAVMTGANKIILPKPVVTNGPDLDKMLDLIAQRRVKTTVASNWHYSQLTKQIAQALQEAREQGLHVIKAELDYSKQRAKLADTIPPLCELPHALQILHSTGLVNFSQDQPQITQATPAAVSVQYRPQGIGDGIQVTSDLQAKPADPNYRKRELKIYLDDGDPEADIIGDFNVEFNSDGTCRKPGNIHIDIGQGPNRRVADIPVTEDNLDAMYQAMQSGLSQPWDQFQADPAMLSLARYAPIAKQVFAIQEQWDKQVNGRTPKTA